MIALVAASISVLMAIVFLGWYVFTIVSIPLSIVIAIGVGLILVDFYSSMRQPETEG